MKKLFRVSTLILIIGGLVGGFTFVARNEKLKKTVMSFNNERDAYRTHHRPQEGWYYSVESDSTEPTSGKKFIIGRNMQPLISTTKGGEVSITLRPNDKLREIEVPAKTERLKSTAIFFTVKTVDGKPTLIYFPSEREVIVHMLRAQQETEKKITLRSEGRIGGRAS